MADIDIIAVGRLKQAAEEKLAARYAERIKKAGPTAGIRQLNNIELSESNRPNIDERKEEEASRIIERAKQPAFIIAMDEKGKSLTSLALSDKMRGWIDEGHPRLIFAIGGPDGHGRALLDNANFKLSLSQLTLPHGLARVFLMEQIYRSLTIWSGHPYHRE